MRPPCKGVRRSSLPRRKPTSTSWSQSQSKIGGDNRMPIEDQQSSITLVPNPRPWRYRSLAGCRATARSPPGTSSGRGRPERHRSIRIWGRANGLLWQSRCASSPLRRTGKDECRSGKRSGCCHADPAEFQRVSQDTVLHPFVPVVDGLTLPLAGTVQNKRSMIAAVSRRRHGGLGQNRIEGHLPA